MPIGQLSPSFENLWPRSEWLKVDFI